MFMAELLGEALQAVAALDVSTYQSTRASLQAASDARQKQFREAEIPPEYRDIFGLESAQTDIKIDDIFKAPNFCHTTRLPAEIRYKGILTNHPPGDMFNFTDTGISQAQADSTPNLSEEFSIVVDAKSRQAWCTEVHLNMDYKDFFYLNQQDGLKKIVLPNDRELAEYGRGQEMKGLVAACYGMCNCFVMMRDMKRYCTEKQFLFLACRSIL